MNPLITMAFVFGYGLALPIGSKLGEMRKSGNRIGFVGHQLGVMLAAFGWAARSSGVLVLFHLLWLVAAAVWFKLGPNANVER